MRKNNYKWTISELLRKFEDIEFPEFQREATIWDIDKKQRLIDSIIRDIDIASIYFNLNQNNVFECIDGRQRINAIYSFIGLNSKFSDDKYTNNFMYISFHELKKKNILSEFHNKKWDDLTKDQQQKILDYEFNVIEVNLTESDELDNELNLMFLRLQLGAPLNAGEKLHAMVGDMRDFIFRGTDALGKKLYFEFLKIPERRFSRELTAAQIALNFFSYEINRDFKRARFLDLQDFFKSHIDFKDRQQLMANKLRERLDVVYEKIKDKKIDLKNRAIGITTFFFINRQLDIGREDQIDDFIKFLKLFVDTLREQVKRGIDIDRRYQELLKFQSYISQAAVEKYAIENRQKFLEEYFEYYLQNNNKIKTT